MAPIIAALIKMGLPLIAGAVVSKGKEIIQDKLGVNLDDALGTEEGRLSLKQLELEHEQFLIEASLVRKEQDIRETALYIGDVDSARRREVEIASSTDAPYINKVVTPYIAVCVLVMTFIIFAILLFSTMEIPAARKEIIIYVLGVLSTISTQIIAYYFGSSRGSSIKDETIQAMQGVK